MTLTLLLTICLSTLVDVTLASTTIVSLTDVELNELLKILFLELNGANSIPMNLLVSLGLNTPSVISLLQNLGYIILG